MATDALNLTGIWLSAYEYESTGRGVLTSGHRVALVHDADRLHVRSVRMSLAELSMDLVVDGRVITGTWAERTEQGGHYQGASYHGTVQMILNAAGDQMTGRWAGFSRDMATVNTGAWSLTLEGSVADDARMVRVTDLEDSDFGRLFTDFRHTAYRLETLQVYDVAYEQESYAAWLAGDPDALRSLKGAWAVTVAQATAAGKRFQRVHVVEEPLTDYLRYEIEGYRYNVEAGEDVRVIPVQRGQWPRELPHRDYWLFDSAELWVMEYDEAGRFLGAVHVEDAEDTIMHGYWRDAALHEAIPYADYTRRLLETHDDTDQAACPRGPEHLHQGMGNARLRADRHDLHPDRDLPRAHPRRADP